MQRPREQHDVKRAFDRRRPVQRDRIHTSRFRLRDAGLVTIHRENLQASGAQARC